MLRECKPYTIFNKTKNVPVRVWYKGKIDDTLLEWDTDLWIERGEDWYALMSSSLRDKRVRIIERDIWLRSALI
jgi:hypothetical protein